MGPRCDFTSAADKVPSHNVNHPQHRLAVMLLRLWAAKGAELESGNEIDRGPLGWKEVSDLLLIKTPY
jgi:hypothetical protein